MKKRDYRKDLEKAARQMILVRRVDTLSKLILRTIMRNVNVKHAGILLYDKKLKEYTVTVSEGEKGIKVPAGFTKVKPNNPIIKYFTDKNLVIFKQDFLLNNRINYYLKSKKIKNSNELTRFLNNLKEELSLYQAKAVIPGYFRNNLVGVLFLGSKQDKTSFTRDELGFLSVLASDVVMAIQNAWLFEDLNAQLNINKKLFLSTVSAFATAIEAKDKYTMGHTERVVRYSLAIAKYLNQDDSASFKKDFTETLRIAALLHDIGKIGIPEEILNKKSVLDNTEKQFISKHPLVGAEILKHISEFDEVITGVKYHHERYDGSGYPSGLSGSEIPITAMIIAVADSFDAMMTDRPYRNALSRQEAIEEIKQNSGKQFAPVVVDAFVKFIQDELSPTTLGRNVIGKPRFDRVQGARNEHT